MDGDTAVLFELLGLNTVLTIDVAVPEDVGGGGVERPLATVEFLAIFLGSVSSGVLNAWARCSDAGEGVCDADRDDDVGAVTEVSADVVTESAPIDVEAARGYGLTVTRDINSFQYCKRNAITLA